MFLSLHNPDTPSSGTKPEPREASFICLFIGESPLPAQPPRAPLPAFLPHPVLDLQVWETHPLALAQGHHGAFNGLQRKELSGLARTAAPGSPPQDVRDYRGCSRMTLTCQAPPGRFRPRTRWGTERSFCRFQESTESMLPPKSVSGRRRASKSRATGLWLLPSRPSERYSRS